MPWSPATSVTGEAVELELRPASFATRALALVLDLAVQLGLLVGGTFLLAALLAEVDEALSAALSLAMVVGVLVGLPVAVETLTRGRSLGKLAAGLRVVRDDGGPVRFRHALARGLLAVGETYLLVGSGALIASLSNDRGKRLGDMVAGTYVVRERTAAGGGLTAAMPPELAGWAAGADIGRLPPRLALAVRQLLSRADRLAPSSRQRLGAELAADVARYVAPPPPPGTHPERFLAAVLAERRRRDLDRLRREAASRAARDAQRASASPLSAVGTRLVGEE